ncbi:MAG: hypothetical protein AAFV43_15475 [Planctomycetota bacterium]
MSALQCVAWLEVLVSVGATALAIAALPLLGDAALAAFGLMGLLGFSFVLLKSRGESIVVDERDRAIDRRAIRWGAGAGWVVLLLGCVAIVVRASLVGQETASLRALTWLVATQPAIVYTVKGLTALASYRADHHATQV